MMQAGPTVTQLLFRGFKLTLLGYVLDHLNGSTDRAIRKVEVCTHLYQIPQ